MNQPRANDPLSSSARRSILGRFLATLRRHRKFLGVALVSFLVLELFALPRIPRVLPLYARTKLPPPLYIIGQATVDEFPPKDYVLLLGDSYAEGWGDWMRELEDVANPKFCHTHLMHEAGLQVLNFGRGGADNVSAMAYLLNKRLAALWRIRLAPPPRILVQFYEGNDLSGNLEGAVRRGAAAWVEGAIRPTIPAAEYVRLEAKRGFRDGLPGSFYSTYLLLNLLKPRRLSIFSAERLELIEGPPPDANVVHSGGRLYHLDGRLQGPAPGLNEDTLQYGFDLLEESLAYLLERFPESEVILLYIPSPASCYELHSPIIRTASQALPGVLEMDSQEVWRRADDMRSRVAALCRGFEIRFLDATDAARAAAALQPLHGPVDGHHFNRAGYIMLAAVALEGLMATNEEDEDAAE
ncbi:MAG: hypothetical protein O2816_01050 [Planctomycetota bacterium]|nr:hypothetical protein [Planctomycetota bacterium]